MTDMTLIRNLNRMAHDPERCYGCGHEHNCAEHGCAIILEAAQRLQELTEDMEHRETA